MNRDRLRECLRKTHRARQLPEQPPDARASLRSLEGALPKQPDDPPAGVGEARPAEPPTDLAQRQLDAVDKALGPWEPPPDSETGVTGRVQTILNLQADRAEILRLREQLDAARLPLIRYLNQHNLAERNRHCVCSYCNAARAALGVGDSRPEDLGGALDQRAVETRGGDS